ncbi:MAG: type II toxin-antitoxin system VapC family toxin [Rhodospirillaceae bacterium]|nr:type II toxin-antitoxin system VapC family toxin [Rhodospirillaceae bacterium]
MRLLLDTNALLWSATDPDQLRPEAREIIRAAENRVYVSTASLWEIAIKQSIGKLRLKGGITSWLLPVLSELRFDLLGIEPSHVADVSELPLLHRDPFDRMLVVQAKSHALTLVTRDKHLKNYGLSVLDA